MYRHFSEQDHVLMAKWEGPVYLVNKVSPTVYQLVINKNGTGKPWRK